jgi:hypothetical protein
MRSNPVEFDLALIEKVNQSWPRDIQKIGGLLGCEFRMKRNQLDCIAAAHLIQNLNEKMRGLGRDSDRWFFEGVDSAQIKRRGRTQAWSQNLLASLASLTSSSEGMKETRWVVADIVVDFNCDYRQSQQTKMIEILESGR